MEGAIDSPRGQESNILRIRKALRRKYYWWTWKGGKEEKYIINTLQYDHFLPTFTDTLVALSIPQLTLTEQFPSTTEFKC